MALGDFDSRWKDPQGSDNQNMFLWAQNLIKELRKGDYISNAIADGISNDELAEMAAWTIKMRNSASAGAPQDVTINGLTEETTPDNSADFLMMWDTSAGTMDKVKPSALIPAGGITTISSGSIGSGTTKDITGIPATYAYLLLHIAGASCDTATRALMVQVSTNNGSSFDATAANYVGYYAQTTPTFVNVGVASLIGGGTVTAATAQTSSIKIFGYQGGGDPLAMATLRGSGINFNSTVSYIGSTSAINALRLLWNGTGNFDAGTYALYGIS